MKIVDFSNARTAEITPNDHDTLLRHLNLVKADIADEFSKAILINLEEQLLFKGLIDARESPFLFKHLVGKLSPSQFNRLLKIALHANSVDPFSIIQGVVEELFSIITPTEKSLGRAKALVATIREKTGDYKARALRYRFLADLTLILGFEEAYYDVVIDRLSQMTQSDIEELEKLI